MRLYLVQHGESTSEQIDPARPLTEKGKVDVSKVANLLKRAEVEVDVICHSTKIRAIQTAKIISEALQIKEVMQREGLAPNDPVENVYEGLLRDGFESIMIMGHLPFLSKLASLLLVDDPSKSMIEFQQGGVVCLEKSESNEWRVVWMVVPDLLKES